MPHTEDVPGLVSTDAAVATWTHLVATYKAPIAGDATTGVMTLYQDGARRDTAVNVTPQYGSGLPLTVGGCVNAATATVPYKAFPGKVAGLHVYPRVLTATEVAALN